MEYTNSNLIENQSMDPREDSVSSYAVKPITSYESLVHEEQNPDTDEKQEKTEQNDNSSEFDMAKETIGAYGVNTTVEDIFAQKVEIIKLKIKDIMRQIKEREKLKEINIEKMDQMICDADTKLLNLGWMGWPGSDSRELLSRKTALEGDVNILEREKRLEEVHCFGDITQLKKRLADELQEYRELMRKSSMFNLKG
jgi:hypothetical protein